MTRGERAIKFIEAFCCVPEGKHVGKPIKLLPFQKKFILDVFDNPHITDTAILSIGRKNGKSAIIACIIILFLFCDGFAVRNSQIISGAMSRDQARIVFKLVKKMILLNPRLEKLSKVTNTHIEGLLMGVVYTAIAAEAKTAMGASPVLAIIDEVGQVVGGVSDFVESITTAQGAHDNPLMIYISTQAPTDTDLLSIMIDDYKEHKPLKTVCHVYEADKDADLMDREQWVKANPALGVFRNEADMKKLAEQAERMPSKENSFRNLNLNQRVSLHSSFISRNAWEDCGGDIIPMSECEQVYAGLDLSARTDLTAFVLYGVLDGIWYAEPHFFTPKQGLFERAKQDRAPYDVWVERGHMMAIDGATIDYEFVAKYITDLVEDINLVAIAYDRWRMDVLKKELERIGSELPLEPWGQGFKDMSPALDSLEAKILNKQLRHGNHPVLNMCAQNTVVSRSPAGDRKPDKAKTSGRIDGMVALAMAAGIADRALEEDGDLGGFISAPLIF